MWTLYQSTQIAPAERFRAWNRAVERVIGEFQTHFGKTAEQFRAEMQLRDIGGLECLRIVQNTNMVRRSLRELARRATDRFCLVLQVRGLSWMSQDSREAHLRPGDLTLLDSALPATYRFGHDNAQLVLHLPKSLVADRLPYEELPLATALKGSAVAVCARLMETAFEQAPHCADDEAAAIREALLGLLFQSVLSGNARVAPADATTRSTLQAVREHILTRLSDPALSPASIAAEHGISVRHLHRLFAPGGTTVNNWIRQQRLRRCAADLRNRSLRVKNLTAISHQWGFSDSATFSRAFRLHFGQPPSKYRSRYS